MPTQTKSARTNTIRTSNSPRKSCSDITSLPNNKKHFSTYSSKRRSLGSIKSQHSSTTTATTITTTTSTTSTTTNSIQKNPPIIWRSPGHCEIPNILGNAYLEEPFTIPTVSKRQKEETGPKRPPWIPVGSNWVPGPLPPIIKLEESSFEKRLKKVIPKIQLVNMPKTRYIGSKEIGTGVNGAVVQVMVKNNTNTSSSIRLALKRCKLDHDREYRAAIVRELRIMSSGHYNLIKLKEASIFKNEVWIAMDLMRCSAFAILCSKALPEELAIYIGKEALNALIFLHTKGFIHRDIKCENLLIGPNGEIKLADFGLATSIKHTNRERLGTAKWMAPEVIKEIPYDEKVDLWSLGITFIEMMDRVPPHYNLKEDEDVFSKILEDTSPTFTYSYPSIYCTGLVAWLLEEDPENRPTAKDVMTELDLHLDQGLLKSCTPQELAHFVTKTLKSHNI